LPSSFVPSPVPSPIALVADGIDFRSSIHADLPEGHEAACFHAQVL
jgi:hypothetical protein